MLVLHGAAGDETASSSGGSVQKPVPRPVPPKPPSRHAGKPVISTEERAVQNASEAERAASLSLMNSQCQVDMVADVGRHPVITGGRNEGRLLQLCVVDGRLKIKTGPWSMLRRVFNRMFGTAERLDDKKPTALHEWMQDPSWKDGAWILCTPAHVREARTIAVANEQQASDTYSRAVQALSHAKIAQENATRQTADAIAALDDVLASR